MKLSRGFLFVAGEKSTKGLSAAEFTKSPKISLAKWPFPNSIGEGRCLKNEVVHVINGQALH